MLGMAASKRLGWNAVTLAAVAVAGVLAVPVLVVVSSVFAPLGDAWEHLAATVLPEYIANTLWLMLWVGFGVSVIGVATAWLTTLCRFPGRGFFEWALILPLAVPAYVMAYAYTDFLQFTGPVQAWLRAAFGWGPRDYWFPDVRSLGGAGVIFSFVFYPYVYLLARAAFLEQAAGMVEAGRSLGYGPWRSLFRLALPLATRMILTELDFDADGDTTFPDVDRTSWHAVDRRRGDRATYVTYERRAAATSARTRAR